ncbi:MAG: type I restriction-modification system subunit M [Endomicrobium sp.]|jgi:type I restriction enzyme M protein|nr:type I restriction-modification system subunit M [Endomicrobium sp.]
MNQELTVKTKTLIDELKTICANNGLGNDGNEFKIITQIFLYKFMNDKFFYEVKLTDKTLKSSDNIEKALSKYSKDAYTMLLRKLSADSARLKKEHFISELAKRMNDGDFHKRLDDTLLDIGRFNQDIFSITTDSGAKIVLFDEISQFITDQSKRDDFCRAIISRLMEFSFEGIFSQKYDFFSIIFEYLIKDYNKDSGGKYAEYYTPHSVAQIMAKILIDAPQKRVLIYDPSAGSGTLLMSIAHEIGDKNCTIYSQDISQKSSSMLRLNLVLNNLVRSIPNIIQGNTILHPAHTDKAGSLMKFDFIVSNPPFKLDFSDWQAQLNSQGERFFAGIPNIPNKDKDKMAIYLLFIQHIMFSLSDTGKAAVVVPTGFITAQSGIEKKIREKIVEKKWLKGVVSMPSNIFATTGTNVSVLFLDKENKDKVVLVDASKLGEKVKDGKNQKTLLSSEDENKIISAFKTLEPIDDFSVVLDYEEIKAKNHSFSAGQYFDVKIEYIDITAKEFAAKMAAHKSALADMFAESRKLETEISKRLNKIQYEGKK